MKLFLLFAGVFLIPVALTYGVDPTATLPKFMNLTVEGTDLTHIFRALGCLYLGMVTFCIIAAFTPEWRHVAVIWAVFFAYSLAIGRISASSSMASQAACSSSSWRSSLSWAPLGFCCSTASGAQAESRRWEISALGMWQGIFAHRRCTVGSRRISRPGWRRRQLIPIRSDQRKPLQPGWREAKLL